MAAEQPCQISAQDQLDRINQLLFDNAGLQSVSVNGTSTTYADLLKQRDYWKKEAARESGAVRRVKAINLGGFR